MLLGRFFVFRHIFFRKKRELFQLVSLLLHFVRREFEYMSIEIEKTIDIDKILRDKMGSKAKFVPSFAINWLKRILHEDEVNKFLWDSRGLTGTEWLTECVRYLDMTLQIEGLENLPDKNDGKLYTFVSNHPLGGQDGVALGSIIGKHYDGRFRYLVNDLLLNLPGLKPVSIGINKTGNRVVISLEWLRLDSKVITIS